MFSSWPSIVKPAPVGAAKSPGPISKVSLIVAIVVSVALFLVLLLIAAILYRRRQLYGSFYICTAPPLPDMIPRLDSSIPLIEQVNKLPYDKRWEFPREQLHFGKVWICLWLHEAGIDTLNYSLSIIETSAIGFPIRPLSRYNPCLPPNLFSSIVESRLCSGLFRPFSGDV